MNKEKLLEMKSISKQFYGVYALNEVDFELLEGEIHAICGENGAGKSTLMKILVGNYSLDVGEIFIKGQKVKIRNSLEAEKLGISIVYQELNLSPTISVSENIFLGREICNRIGLISKRAMFNEAKKYLNILGQDINPNELVANLSISKRQLVQIAKALSMNARVLILDEPCSSLSQKETLILFAILRDLRKHGIGIVYIDHRIDNILEISDRVTILRDGSKIITRKSKEISKDEIIRLMVGRNIKTLYCKTSSPSEDVALRIENMSNKKIKDINLDIRKGEVYGFAGLAGAGRSEIFRAIFRIDKIDKKSRICINEHNVNILNPIGAIRHGIGYISEDRKLDGLFLYKNIIFNTIITNLKCAGKSIFVNKKRTIKTTETYIAKLNIKTRSITDNVIELSGGNQQKVVLAKWLSINNIKILLMDEPTRGIDVGAKHEIYKLINNLAENGITILLITSELPELLGLCDRIAVINDGRIKGILKGDEFSQEAIMKLCV